MDKITSAYEWIKKNIESSNSPFHVEGCKRLMQLFIEMYGKGELEENQLRKDALQKLIDKQLQEDEEEDENQDKVNQMKASIKNKIMEEDQDDCSITENPMKPVLRKK